MDEIQDILHGTVVDEVGDLPGIEDWSLVEPITRLCEDEGRVVLHPHHGDDADHPGGRLEDFHGMQILSLVYGPDRILGIAIKRLLDIVIAAAALILLSPLFLAIAAAIWFQDGRPILFRQERVGLHGRRSGRQIQDDGPRCRALLSDLEAANEIQDTLSR